MNKINIHNLDLDAEFDGAGQPLREGMGAKRGGKSVPLYRNGKLKTQEKISPHEGRERFNSQLQIGSRIFFRMDRAVDDYSSNLGVARPVIVYALWRDQAHNIRKMEVLTLSTQLSKTYSSDFYVTPELQKKFKTAQPEKMKTPHLFLVDNVEKYFPTERYVEVIDQSLWPDILVRRANALIYSPGSQFTMVGEVEEGLVREGFTFRNIQSHNVKVANGWSPDQLGGDFERADSPLVHPDMIDVISGYSANYFAINHEGFKVFPPFKEWHLKTLSFGYPDWEEGNELGKIPHVLRTFKPQ